MINTEGKVVMTPEWKARVDAGETNWWGVAEDVALIAGSGASAVLSGPAKFAIGALLYGLKGWQELHGTEKPK